MGPQIASITTFSDQIKAFDLIHSDSSECLKCETHLGSSNPGPLVECSGSHFMMFHAWHSESLNVHSERHFPHCYVALQSTYNTKDCHSSSIFERGISIAIPSNILTTLLHSRLSTVKYKFWDVQDRTCPYLLATTLSSFFSPHCTQTAWQKARGKFGTFEIGLDKLDAI